VANATPQPL